MLNIFNKRKRKDDLFVLFIEITKKCNARCSHCGSSCDISNNKNIDDRLTKENLIPIFKDIKKRIGNKFMINVTGGEPLIRDDLFDIMEPISKMGFDWSINTNGYLINDDIIEKMKKSGLKTISISLDGYKETHNRFRGIDNLYEKNIENIKKLKKANFLDFIEVIYTVTKENLKDFEKVYNELLNLHCLNGIRTSPVDMIGKTIDNKALLLDKNEIDIWIDTIRRLNKEHYKELPIEVSCCHYYGHRFNNYARGFGRYFDCMTGENVASILNNGDIYVCPNVPRRKELIQGNIFKDNFVDVWTKKYKYFINRKNKPIKYCENCEYYNECKGDSLHSFDFDNNKPNFCYRDTYGSKKEIYKKYIESKGQTVEEINVVKENKVNVIIEKEAYNDIKTYFHIGKKQPLSMFEQQMGLVGFKINKDYVVKYVFPSINNVESETVAKFKFNTLFQSIKTSKQIIKNFSKSDDKVDLIGLTEKDNRLMFLGFIHSHPSHKNQENKGMYYSDGDVFIHSLMYKLYKHYVGIVVNPQEDVIGCYVDKNMEQGNLYYCK